MTKNDLRLKHLSRAKVLTGILYLTMFFSFLFFLLYPVYANDYRYWLYRIDAFAEAVQKYGISALPLRITESTYQGYGYGAPLFYGSIFLVIPSLLVAAGLPLIRGYCVLSLELWAARFFVAYFSAKYLVKKMQTDTYDQKQPKKVALIFAFLYQFFPYMIELLLARSAMGETAASTILPLITASFYVLIFSEKADRRDSVLFAVGMSVLVCSHVLSTYIICLVLALFFLFHSKTVLRQKRLRYFLLSVVLTVVLSAYWSLPFLEQMLQSYITVGSVAGIANLYGSRVTLTELLCPFLGYSIYYRFRNGYGIGSDGFYPSCYVWLLLLALVLCFYMKEKWKTSLPKRLVFYACALAVFMSCGPLLQIADRITLLRIIQFPWRLLLIVSLFLAVGLTYFYFKTDKLFVKNLILLAVAVCALTTGLRNVYLSMTDGLVAIPEVLSNDDANTFCDTLYHPAGAVKAEFLARGEEVTCSNSELDYTWSREDGAILVTYSECDEPSVLELPLLYYYGYSASDSQNAISLSLTKSEHGLVEITIPANMAGTVRVSYTGTTLQHITKWISFIGWIVVIIWLFLYHREKKKIA